MKISKSSDILLNVFFPLVAGYIIYCLSGFHSLYLLIKNYFPDGLWAYSFLSALLIIWRRQVNVGWISFVFLLAAFFELAQYLQWTAGTGDSADVIMYFIFFGAALCVNKYFKKTYSNETGNNFNPAYEKQ
jgi:hypothetical protein